MFLARSASRAFSTTRASMTKVTVLGAAGGIGQPLSLLLKLNENIDELSLYDVASFTPGVAADLSHINTKAKVTGFKKDGLKEALTGSDIVVIPAGVPRKPGMSRDDLFNTNAGIVAELVHGVAQTCPKAMILIIANPVNSTVPIAAEILKKANVYDPRRLFGVTTLDVLRASTFVAESQGWPARSTDVTVIGGHAGTTILPLLSSVSGAKLTQAQIEALTFRIQFGGDEVVKAKDGAGSATLSMAQAADRFTGAVLRALKGETGISECAFVQSGAVPGTAYFSTRITLTRDGVGAVQPVPTLSAYEQAGLAKAVPELNASIAKGIEFAAKWTPKA